MTDTAEAVVLAAGLTSAWLSNPHTRVTGDEIPAFLISMHKAVLELNQQVEPAKDVAADETYAPATTARRSLASPDHIVSMIDGKKYKALRRHLSANGLTPDAYRQRYNLKDDYPMVAPAYSEARRAMAKTLGLGRKAGTKVEKAVEVAAKSVRKSGKAALEAARQALGTQE